MSDTPKTTMALLTRKQGTDGSYFVGYAGAMMITLTKLPKPDAEGREVWILKASNPPKKREEPKKAETFQDADIPF